MFDGGISTVKSAKKFLDEELKKYDSWNDIEKCLNKSIKALFEGKNMIIGMNLGLMDLLDLFLKRCSSK